MSRIVTVALLLAMSCKGAPKHIAVESGAATPPPEVHKDGTPAYYTTMHALLERAEKARHAMVMGDLLGAQVHLKELSTTQAPDGLPGDAEAWMARIRQAAFEGTRTDRSIEVGESIAGVLLECGGCHQQTGKGPMVPNLAPTPARDMSRHVWASDRFLEGLVTPSPLRWDQGAAALILAGEQEQTFLAGLNAQEAMAANVLHERVHTTGKAALDSDNAGHQIAVYGAYLAACAECHAITGGGPAK